MQFDPDPKSPRSRSALLGFVASAQLASEPKKSRAWWATRLELSRSYITEMASSPSRSFVALLEPHVQERHTARLRPRLAEYYVQLMPGDRGSDCADSLAGYFDALDEADPLHRALPYLLHAEVVIARYQRAGPDSDKRTRRLVRRCIDELLTLASGPYGCSTLATQRCADLALLAPDPFFDEIERHLFHSVVGFRALRVLERVHQVWRYQDAGAGLHPRIDNIIMERIVELLRRLADAASALDIVDPYPGAEWAMTLAREHLYRRGGSPTARRLLNSVAVDQQRSRRERLFAAWIARATDVMDEETPDAFLPGASGVIDTWRDALKGQGDPKAGLAGIRELLRETVHDQGVDPSLEASFASLIVSVLVTPNGRLRRYLIEAVPAAGLVPEVVSILLAVQKAIADPFVQECVLFFLSRMREPDPAVFDLIARSTEADVADPHVVQTALWAIGDTFAVDRREEVVGRGLPVRLVERAQRPGHEGLAGLRIRMAAGHALAIIAPGLEDTRAVSELVATLAEGQHGRPDPVARLARWADQRVASLSSGPYVVDPIAV